MEYQKLSWLVSTSTKLWLRKEVQSSGPTRGTGRSPQKRGLSWLRLPRPNQQRCIALQRHAGQRQATQTQPSGTSVISQRRTTRSVRCVSPQALIPSRTNDLTDNKLDPDNQSLDLASSASCLRKPVFGITRSQWQIAGQADRAQ